jgi:tetratricopeptide (TPR) repeat protein
VNTNVVFALLLRIPEYYELLTRYEFLLAGIDRPRLAAAFYECLGSCQWYFCSFDIAIDTMRKAIELFELSENPERAASVNFLLSWAYVYKGEYEEVLASKDAVLQKVSEHSSPRVPVTEIGAVSYALGCLGRWRESLELAQKALSIAKESSDDSLISWAEMIMSMMNRFKGETSQAIKYGELAVKNAETPLDKAWAQIVFASAWSQAGRPEKVIETLKPVYGNARDTKAALIECASGWYLAEGYLLTQEYEEAKRTAEASLAIAERCGMPHNMGLNQRLLGEIALKTNPDDAPLHFEKAISIASETKAKNELALAYSGMGRYHKQQGDTDEARKYLTKALEIFERLGTLIAPDKVREELADLPQ